MEMIHRDDYVVPRFMGELYLSKPPLHSWLIALTAGAQVRQVSIWEVGRQQRRES